MRNARGEQQQQQRFPLTDTAIYVYAVVGFAEWLSRVFGFWSVGGKSRRGAGIGVVERLQRVWRVYGFIGVVVFFGWDFKN